MIRIFNYSKHDHYLCSNIDSLKIQPSLVQGLINYNKSNIFCLILSFVRCMIYFPLHLFPVPVHSLMVQLDHKMFNLLCCAIEFQFANFIVHLQVSSQKVLEKKQELEILESKAKSWSEFLHSHCMMEGYQSYTNTIKAVSGYLQQRKSCKSIRQNLKVV